MHKSNLVIDFDPSSVSQYVKKNYNIVAVDVLRATSTIIVAFESEAAKIIPCSEIEEAKKFKSIFNALLIGERYAQKIPGFDFTNSPADLHLQNKTFKGKTAAITTSTGTKVITESKRAPNILIGSTLNAKFVAQKMAQLKGNWALIGAGTRGDFRMEDQVGCALIAEYYSKIIDVKTDKNSQDIIRKATKNIQENIFSSPSAQKLIDIKRKFDVDFVIENINKYKSVPYVTIEKYKDEEILIIKNEKL